MLLFGLITAVGGIGLCPAPAAEVAPGLPPALPAHLIPTLVPHEKLRALLPEPPPGWSGEKPESSTTDSSALRLSRAQRSYYEGMEEISPSAVVTFIDSPENGSTFELGKGEQWEQDRETKEGYDRRVEIDGMRAIEHYDKAARTGSLSVFVGNRYFVQIELTNVDPKELRTWLGRIDTKRLAALK